MAKEFLQNMWLVHLKDGKGKSQFSCVLHAHTKKTATRTSERIALSWGYEDNVEIIKIRDFEMKALNTLVMMFHQNYADATRK